MCFNLFWSNTDILIPIMFISTFDDISTEINFSSFAPIYPQSIDLHFLSVFVIIWPIFWYFH